MIPEADLDFRRWARWMRAPVPGESLGYGTSVLARIMEGRGEILPGAPRGSGPKKIEIDPVGVVVQQWIAHADRKHRMVIRGWYLVDGTAEERARNLHMAERTLYWHLGKAHQSYIYFLHARA